MIKKLFKNLLHSAETLSSEAEQNAENYTDSAITEKTQYSTTETAVGTWVDGKTLYRRTFTGTLNNAVSTPITSDKSVLIPNVTPVKAEGILSLNRQAINIGSYLNGNFYSGIYWTDSNIVIYNSSNLYGFEYRLIVYYTK